ncbi:hypothetical protein EFO83_09055 [Lacticaseibacillus rhamnosus]|uniref:hypothetical protein n=1 Tax=Lacticaseibacillus rhamnosus TaxID=47715 RepID=UPI0021A68ECB|nr:hypothetical protein [Lacticaseibacillus rhamnosus]MCT3192166.1 hypothetical protein [Lacticaseibacillus rhamnosus]MCT3371252.1 hypothetical protein [Lacticaseibacillus rhamnosus]
MELKKKVISVVMALTMGLLVGGCSSQSAKPQQKHADNQVVLKQKPIDNLNSLAKKSYILSATNSGKAVTQLSKAQWKKQNGAYALAFPDAKHMIVEKLQDGKFYYGREYELLGSPKKYLQFKQVAYLVSEKAYNLGAKASRRQFRLTSKSSLPGLAVSDKLYQSSTYKANKSVLAYKLYTYKQQVIRDVSTSSSKQMLQQYIPQK